MNGSWFPLVRRASRALPVAAATIFIWHPAGAQVTPEQEAYARVVAAHFQMPPGEAVLLMEGPMAGEELPVVLFYARETGMAPAALVALRRGGASWLDLGRRHGLGNAALFVEIPDGDVDGSVQRVQRLYTETPRDRWDTISLSDAEVVVLVHLRVFTRQFGVSPGEVLRARARAGSWFGVPPLLADARN